MIGANQPIPNQPITNTHKEAYYNRKEVLVISNNKQVPPFF
jgi:hypothetical protein